MFIGHYGISFAARSFEKTIPLWLLFLAVQFVDVVWAILVLAGIEKVRIVPGITATNPLDLYYMPYTHSLVGAAVWSLIALAAYKFARGGPTAGAVLIGLAVVSHWVLDLIVHIPDLPIYDNTAKVGLGLWNYPATAFGLEIVLLFGGLVLYIRSSTARSQIGRFGMPALAVILVGLQAIVFFGAPPESPSAAAVTALFAFLLFAALAFWLERYRQ